MTTETGLYLAIILPCDSIQCETIKALFKKKCGTCCRHEKEYVISEIFQTYFFIVPDILERVQILLNFQQGTVVAINITTELWVQNLLRKQISVHKQFS
jgi:hypothetical protein